MRLPPDGDMCFFLLTEATQAAETQEKQGKGEGRKRVALGDRSAVHRVKVLAVTSLSKHCLLVEPIWVCGGEAAQQPTPPGRNPPTRREGDNKTLSFFS